jgi:hypothetical protein
MTEATCDLSGIAAVNKEHAETPAGVVARTWLWVLRLVGQVRRQFLSRFRPRYVARMRRLRHGTCRGCGSCCDLTFHCPFLTPEKRCKIYQRRFVTCRDFPIDATDLRLTRVPCGHYFVSEPEDVNRANSPG